MEANDRHGYSQPTAAQYQAAQDEIKRLRKALEDVRDEACACSMDHDTTCDCQARQIAQSALEGPMIKTEMTATIVLSCGHTFQADARDIEMGDRFRCDECPETRRSNESRTASWFAGPPLRFVVGRR